MHRDTVTKVVVSHEPTPNPARASAPIQDTSSDFFITGSVDGFVKFWKKQPTGVEFVKMYRAHLGPVDGEGCGEDGVRRGERGCALEGWQVLGVSRCFRRTSGLWTVRVVGRMGKGKGERGHGSEV